MDNEQKRITRERHERYLKKHYRTYDEEKQLQSEIRARRAGRPPKRHRRSPELDKEHGGGFEKIPAAPRAAGPRQATHELPPSPLELPPSARSALVVAVHRTHVRLRPEEGERRELDARTRVPLVVGDRVWFDRTPEVQVLARQVRRSQLSRAYPSGARVLAANIDLGLIVASLRRPNLRAGLVDRVRVALVAGGVEPLVVLTKLDLLSPDERRELPARLEPLGLAEPASLRTSVATGEGLDELRERLLGKTSVLVGHSGVGKSSLLNALRPGTDQAVAAGRDFDGKGRHTTSASSLFELEGGARLIDTPGIRSFALDQLGPRELAAAFPDVVELAARCRYRDCRHESEPDCAVRAALERGSLAELRWRAYRKLAP